MTVRGFATHFEMGTQTQSSPPSPLGSPKINGGMKNTSIQTSASGPRISRKHVQTFVRMKGYPSARLRRLRPPSYVSPLPSPKKKINHPTPKRSVTSKIDNKGLFILHHTSPTRKINHKLPRVKRVSTKIDNRGIDIRKWRHSMVNLRNIVDPYDQHEGERLNENMKQDIRGALQRKMSVKSSTSSSREQGTQIEKRNISAMTDTRRRHSSSSLGRTKPPTISEDFLSQLKRKLHEKLRAAPGTPETETDSNDEHRSSPRSSLTEETIKVDFSTSNSPDLFETDIKDAVTDPTPDAQEDLQVSKEDIHPTTNTYEIIDQTEKLSENIEEKKAKIMEHLDEEEENPENDSDNFDDFTDSDSDDEKMPNHLAPPSNFKRNDLIELIHLNSLDLEEIQQQDSAANNAIDTAAENVPSTGSSSSNTELEDNNVEDETNPDEIDLDFQTPPSSASTVKTILDKPNTPKITVEDYRNKKDRGYYITETEKEDDHDIETIASTTTTNNSNEQEDDKEVADVKDDQFSVSSDVSDISIQDVDDNESIDDNVDKRSVKLFPKRASSQKTKLLEHDCCLLCYCFGCSERSDSARTLSTIVSGSKRLQPKKIIVKEMDMIGVREKDGSLTLQETPKK